jgi:hypothetical protein
MSKIQNWIELHYESISTEKNLAIIDSKEDELYDQIEKLVKPSNLSGYFIDNDIRQYCWYGLQAAISYSDDRIFDYLYNALINDIAMAPNITSNQYRNQMLDEFLGRGFRDALKKGHLEMIQKLFRLGFDHHYHNDALLREGLETGNKRIVKYALSIGIRPSIRNYALSYYNLPHNIDFLPLMLPYFPAGSELENILSGVITNMFMFDKFKFDITNLKIIFDSIISYKFDDLEFIEKERLLMLCFSCESPKSFVEKFFNYYDRKSKIIHFMVNSQIYDCLGNLTDENIDDNNYDKYLNKQYRKQIVGHKIFWKKTKMSLDPIYRLTSMHIQLILSEIKHSVNFNLTAKLD